MDHNKGAGKVVKLNNNDHKASDEMLYLQLLQNFQIFFHHIMLSILYMLNTWKNNKYKQFNSINAKYKIIT